MQKPNNGKTKEIKNLIRAEIRDIIGFISFFIIFIIIVPIILYKNKLFTVLEVYLPNVDLIANLLTWINGPYDIWSKLYTSANSSSQKNDDSTFLNFTSQVLINYIALLGLTFIVARESVHQKNVFEGWSFAFIMIIITYLLPVPIVNLVMKKANETFKNMNFNIHNSRLMSGGVGLFITLCFLFLETIIIKKYRKNVVHIGKYIYKTPKKFKL